MNVYIEYVVLDNFVIDSLLLWAAAVTLKIPVKKYRIVLGGALGAVCAVVSVFVGGFWLIALKTFCVAVMCVVVVGFGKKFFWYILLVVAYTFVLGGAVIAIFHFFHLSYVTENGEFYQLNVPLFVYVLALAATAFLCYSVAIYVKQTKKTARFLVKATVLMDKEVKVTGFCDSGNTLTHCGVPVCFVTKKFGGFADYFARQTLQGKTCNIEVVTVTGTTSVTAVLAKVSANGLCLDVYLALPQEKCVTAYNLILSNAFVTEENT